MKKVLSVLLLACACAAAQSGVPSNPPSKPPSNAPSNAPQDNSVQSNSVPVAPRAAVVQDPTSRKARELLDQMIAALGGEAWLTYTNVTQQGRSYSFFHGKPTSAGTLYYRFYEYPDKERRELTKERDVIYIYNGDKGYEKTYKGTAPDEEKSVQEFVRRRQHSLEVAIREWLKEPQTVLFYDGQTVADQQLVDVVTLLNKNNDQISIGIDINSHLPINKRFNWRDADKYKVEDETIYGNYRKVQGVETPYTITNKRDGEIIGQSFLTHVEYNTKLDPGFFTAKVTYDPGTYNPNKNKKP